MGITTLTNEQLVHRIQKGGDEVCHDLEQLWIRNRGLINYYIGKCDTHVEYEDLQQEAFIALYTAVCRFRPTQGKFTTYLGSCLYFALSNYCKLTRGPMEIPVHKHALITRVRRAAADFEQRYHRQPSRDELSRILEISGTQIDQAAFLDLARSAASLSMTVGSSEEEDLTLADVLESGETLEDDAVEHVFQDDLKTAVHEELDKLPDEQAQAIRLTYLEGLTRAQAGKVMGLPSYLVQRRIEQGFKALRSDAAARLTPFILN